MRENIVLTGFMGTGKTTIGKIVSQRLGYDFIDTDDYIEKNIGLSIDDIFRLYGEHYFRDVETRAIISISNLSRVVISCGGGAVIRQENIISLRRNGIIICLKADLDTICRRIENGGRIRPLVLGKSREEIAGIMERREHLYSSSDHIIDTSSRDIDDIANQVIGIHLRQGKS